MSGRNSHLWGDEVPYVFGIVYLSSVVDVIYPFLFNFPLLFRVRVLPLLFVGSRRSVEVPLRRLFSLSNLVGRPSFYHRRDEVLLLFLT